MPLAIELAASRATVLPAADILAGLSDRFRLLTGGPRTADTRQQSLAESIRWSYRLLTDEHHDVSRYRLLETIREYAVRQLEASRRRRALPRDRHLRDSAEYIEPIFDGPHILSGVNRLESELPDIRAAVTWAAASNNADDALRLAGALAGYVRLTARADSQRIVEAALAIEGGDKRCRAKALGVANRTELAAAAAGRFS